MGENMQWCQEQRTAFCLLAWPSQHLHDQLRYHWVLGGLAEAMRGMQPRLGCFSYQKGEN